MKKLILLSVAFCAASILSAQTTVTDVLRDAQLKPVSGLITLQWNAFWTPAGEFIAPGRVTIPVVKGKFSVSLSPTDYTATYAISNYLRNPEMWHVCASPTPVSISTVLTACGTTGGTTWQMTTSTWDSTTTTWSTM